MEERKPTYLQDVTFTLGEGDGEAPPAPPAGMPEPRGTYQMELRALCKEESEIAAFRLNRLAEEAEERRRLN